MIGMGPVNPEAHLKNPRDAAHYHWTTAMVPDGSHLIDAGCFDGWLSFLLLKAGKNLKVTAVELRLELVKLARAYAIDHGIPEDRFSIHEGFFTDHTFGPWFNAVLLYEILEHVPKEEVSSYVAKAESFLQFGGKILISLPEQRHEDNPQHLWTPNELELKHWWDHNKNFTMQKVHYGNNIPANWLVSWTV